MSLEEEAGALGSHPRKEVGFQAQMDEKSLQVLLVFTETLKLPLFLDDYRVVKSLRVIRF